MTELESILISSLNQVRFCQRRYALMFVEGLWEENEHTVLGSLIHETADEPGYETDEGVKVVRALPLFSKCYGLTGKADVVEFHGELPYPIEYKKGKRRAFENDEIQLCAQALCLEEMFEISISEGAVFHAASKKRRVVRLDEALRSETISAVTDARLLLLSRDTPAPEYSAKCEECSLLEHCLPHLSDVDEKQRVTRYANKLWDLG